MGLLFYGEPWNGMRMRVVRDGAEERAHDTIDTDILCLSYQRGRDIREWEGGRRTGAELTMKLIFSWRSQYFSGQVRSEANGAAEKRRHLGSYWSSFRRFIVQDAQTVLVRVAIGGKTCEDVGSIYSLSKKRDIAGEVDMRMDIDEQTTRHGHERGRPRIESS
jgi:hypothetical protein